MAKLAPRSKTDLSHVRASNEPQRRLLSRYGALQDWRLVAAEIDISPGMAYQVAIHGYVPKNNAIRGKIGFPELGQGEICPIHGKVCVAHHHTHKTTRKKYVSWKKAYQALQTEQQQFLLALTQAINLPKASSLEDAIRQRATLRLNVAALIVRAVASARKQP